MEAIMDVSQLFKRRDLFGLAFKILFQSQSNSLRELSSN